MTTGEMLLFHLILYNPECSTLKFKQHSPTIYPNLTEIIVKIEKMMSNVKKKKKKIKKEKINV